MFAFLLRQRGTVYTPTAAANGAFTTVARTDLRCLVSQGGSLTDAGEERAEQTEARQLYWEAGYEMPAYAQVLVDGVRWSVTPNSQQAPTGLRGAVLYRIARVVQVG